MIEIVIAYLILITFAINLSASLWARDIRLFYSPRNSFVRLCYFLLAISVLASAILFQRGVINGIYMLALIGLLSIILNIYSSLRKLGL